MIVNNAVKCDRALRSAGLIPFRGRVAFGFSFVALLSALKHSNAHHHYHFVVNIFFVVEHLVVGFAKFLFFARSIFLAQ